LQICLAGSQPTQNKALTDGDSLPTAQSAATRPEIDDERLARVVAAWDGLPEAIRRAMAAMIDATDEAQPRETR